MYCNHFLFVLFVNFSKLIFLLCSVKHLEMHIILLKQTIVAFYFWDEYEILATYTFISFCDSVITRVVCYVTCTDTPRGRFMQLYNLNKGKLTKPSSSPKGPHIRLHCLLAYIHCVETRQFCKHFCIVKIPGKDTVHTKLI